MAARQRDRELRIKNALSDIEEVNGTDPVNKTTIIPRVINVMPKTYFTDLVFCSDWRGHWRTLEK